MSKKANDAQSIESAEVSTAPEVSIENAGSDTPFATATSKSRRLKKAIDFETSTVTISVIGGDKGTMSFPISDLSDAIQKKLAPFGLGHKLGDAAAGLSGPEAEAAIEKVWAGLKANDWTVRTPAAPKLDKKAIQSNFANLDEATRATAIASLKAMGIDPASMGLA